MQQLPTPLLRYSRQIILKKIGPNGQRKIGETSIAIIGCGALGSYSAELLARAGIGRLKLVDRDVVELDNLHRQLYTEKQAEWNIPKAVACAERLKEVNSEVEVEPLVLDVSSSNVLGIIEDVDIILDGTDNFETRFLLNDACLKLEKPCIFGAAIETYGMIFPMIPKKTPCLRDLMDSPPPPGSVPTCEMVGVLNTLTSIVSSLQVTYALKIILGESIDGKVLFVDPWNESFEIISVVRRENCPACVLSKYEYLSKRPRDVELCGRDAVQINPAKESQIDLSRIFERLQGVLDVRLTEHALYMNGRDFQMILFPDGRAIVKGAGSIGKARSIYSRYVGV